MKNIGSRDKQKTLDIPGWDQAKLLEQVGTFSPSTPAQAVQAIVAPYDDSDQPCLF